MTNIPSSTKQMNEAISLNIFRELIPESWVIREHTLDDDIDCVVEILDYVDDDGK